MKTSHLLFLPATTEPAPAQFHLFGVRVHNSRLDDAVADILQRIRSHRQTHIAFVNADCQNKAWNNPGYREVLNGFDRVYADGSGIRLACRMAGLELADNVNGTDLFPLLCRELARQGHGLFLLGGFPGVAQACADAMQRRFPGLRVVGTQHGYFPHHATDEVIQRINDSGADVLLVGFGAPSQEFWLHRHRRQLQPSVRIGVGGLFDFYSGRIPRAPQWLRRLGLEWIWRLLQEPARMWRRYLLGNPLFLWRVWRRPVVGA